MTSKIARIFRRQFVALRFVRMGALVLALASVVSPSLAATLIYQEGFNSDGATNVPPRYTITGRDVYEVPRIQAELMNFDQKGPIYWAHNFNASFAGNPNIPARRMIFTWRGTDGTAATTDLLQLFESSVNWLLTNKPNARIVVYPSIATIQALADRLTAAGHTVVDDDPTTYPDEQDVPGDLFIHGPTGGNASRFVLLPKPVIVISAVDYDDQIVGSIGTSVTFDPGQVTVAAAGHPAAGGKTGSFNAFTAPAQTFELVGFFLPPGATTLATVVRTNPPSVTDLADVDAIIAGTKQHSSSTGTVATLDFVDGNSPGSWLDDNPIPGGYAGNWGLQIKGKITVSTAGTYRFALGSDDGARLQIDVDKNGFTAADTVLEDSGPHAYQLVYANVSLAADTYDIEVRSYNSGGAGSLEVSVAIVPVPVPDDALDSGNWELLGVAGATSPVKLQGVANVTAFIASGPNVQTQEPLVVLLNGPNDTPPGSFYDGGQFTGFEGTGFFGGAGMNKFETAINPKTLALRSVNVAGKQNVKLTVALAATVVDFEDSDFLDIIVYTNGLSSNPTTLAHFRGVQNAVQPWLADQRENYVRRLTRQFADFTYDVPAGAADLVVEFRAITSWWTEILALDNVRITEGAIALPPQITNISKAGSNVTITWINGGTLESTGTLAGAGTVWTTTGDSDGSFTEAATGTKFFRVRQ